MVRDKVVDTHILAEILKQFNPRFPNNGLVKNELLKSSFINLLNPSIISDGYEGKIVASIFAFIEIYNKFDEISDKLFTKEKVYNFIRQSPEWFVIEDINMETIFHYNQLPKKSQKGEELAVEDAVHVATTMLRGPNSILITKDHVIHDMRIDNIEVV